MAENPRERKVFIAGVIYVVAVVIIIAAAIIFAICYKPQSEYGDGKCDECGKTATQDVGFSEMCDDCCEKFLEKFTAQYKKMYPWGIILPVS